MKYKQVHKFTRIVDSLKNSHGAYYSFRDVGPNPISEMLSNGNTFQNNAQSKNEIYEDADDIDRQTNERFRTSQRRCRVSRTRCGFNYAIARIFESQKYMKDPRNTSYDPTQKYSIGNKEYYK